MVQASCKRRACAGGVRLYEGVGVRALKRSVPCCGPLLWPVTKVVCMAVRLRCTGCKVHAWCKRRASVVQASCLRGKSNTMSEGRISGSSRSKKQRQQRGRMDCEGAKT